MASGFTRIGWSSWPTAIVFRLGTNVVLKLVRLDPNDEQFQREMFERTVRDTLTGLYNRAYLLNQIGVLAERSAAQGIGLAVLMLDIDHFKQINDRYGHLAGDGVLRQVAAVIRESTQGRGPGCAVWRRGVCRGLAGLGPGPGDRTRRADSLEPRRAQDRCRGNRDPRDRQHRPGVRGSRPIAQRNGVDHDRRRGPLSGQGRWPQPCRLRPPCDATGTQADRVGRIRVHLLNVGFPAVVDDGTAPARVTCSKRRFAPDMIGAGSNRERRTKNDRSNERRGRPCRNLSRKRLIRCCRHSHWACVAGAFRSRASASSRAFSSELGINVVQIACGDPHHASWEEGEGMPAAALESGIVMTGAMLGFPGEDYTTPQTIKETGGFGNPALRGERIERLKWAIHRTMALGLSDLSLHAGFLPAPDDPGRSAVLETLAEAGKLAAARGITLAFETGQETADLLRLTLDELGLPNLKVNFDPANMLLYDMGDPIRAVEILGPDIRSVHVKDARRPTVAGPVGTGSAAGPGRGQYPRICECTQEERLYRPAHHRARSRRSGRPPARRRAWPGLSARMLGTDVTTRRGPRSPGVIVTAHGCERRSCEPRSNAAFAVTRRVTAASSPIRYAAPSRGAGTAHRQSASAHDGIDDVGQLAPRVGQGIKIVLAGAARLDQAAMTQQRKMMADCGLALGAQIRAELGDIALFFAQEYQHLQAGRIGDLLEQLGDATDLGRRSGRRRSRGFRRTENHWSISWLWEASCSSKRKSCLWFRQADARVRTSIFAIKDRYSS